MLEQFGYEDTIRFFSSLGLMVKERGNYVYPHSDQASTVLELLKLELHRLGIKILTGVQVTDITPISSGFMIKLNTGKQKTDAVILACGGKASSKLGSDGSGYTLAKGDIQWFPWFRRWYSLRSGKIHLPKQPVSEPMLP